MSEDLKAHFSQRATGDSQSLSATMQKNQGLNTLLKSLDGLKGKGYRVSVTDIQVAKPEQDGVVYKPPVASRTVTVAKTGMLSRTKDEASLTIALTVDGEYQFTLGGSGVETSVSSTTVANGATNQVNQWLVDVQRGFDVDIMSTALARAEERAPVKAGQRSSKPV